jgi:xanthine/uracil/vitamin C permease (AzgA family)
MTAHVSEMIPQFTDGLIVVAANIFNLLVTAVFLTRAAGLRRAEWFLGLLVAALALPAAAAFTVNVLNNRELWAIILPAILFSYCVLEFVLDYVLKSNFRHTRFLAVYLAVFYLASFAMIGYSFGVAKQYGFITLATYLAGLLAAWYSYLKAGHG